MTEPITDAGNQYVRISGDASILVNFFEAYNVGHVIEALHYCLGHQTREVDQSVGRMRSRVATRLAWSLCALTLVMTVLSVLLLALNYSHPEAHVYGFWLENTLLPIAFSIIGAIIASRLPANPLGWLFCAAACISAVAHLSGEYAICALLAQPDTLPAGEALAWLTSWLWVLFIGCLVLSLLLFPDGQLPGRRWTWWLRPDTSRNGERAE